MESKNNPVVRCYGFDYRYDTEEERKALSALWEQVCLKRNDCTATKKPVGWTKDEVGRHKRVNDAPQTPLERLLNAGILPDSIGSRAETTHGRDPSGDADARDRTFARQAARPCKETDGLAMKAKEAKERRLKKQQGGVRALALQKSLRSSSNRQKRDSVSLKNVPLSKWTGSFCHLAGSAKGSAPLGLIWPEAWHGGFSPSIPADIFCQDPLIFALKGCEASKISFALNLT